MIPCAQCGAPLTPVVSGQTLCDGCHGLAHPEPSSPLQQVEIAGCTLVRELGAGRHAQSWLARDEQGAPVVLKLLRRYAPDGEAVQRFLAEAERLAAAGDFQHPNLARPITAGVHLASALFLVYQSGGEETLADELRQRGRVLPARALELCAQLCEGLGVIHREGVLHLDLKPANVGLRRLAHGAEQAVVLDLATAHLLASAGLQDDGPLPLSTAAYTSPEQAAGRRADARSDLYAVGVLLFQLLSGQLPVPGATSDQLLEAHRAHQPLRLRDLGHEVHGDVEELIARLLAKKPVQRPQGADEAAVMMRALIPVADLVWLDDGAPAPEIGGPPQAPAPLPPPPRMLPPAVDPALERAMLGEVLAQQPEAAPPGIPDWAAAARPRWWPLAGGAAAIAVLTLVAMLLSRRPAGAPQAPSVATASPVAPARAKAALPAAAGEAMRRDLPRDPPEDPTLLGQGGRLSAPPARKAAASRYAQSFDRAQKALWVGHAASAESILRDLLRKPLTRPDRARAAKLMGDAQTRRGRRAAAAAWYRKALRLSDDPEDRASVEKLLR